TPGTGSEHSPGPGICCLIGVGFCPMTRSCCGRRPTVADLCACHTSPYATCSYPGGCGSPGGCCDPATRLCATCAAVRGLCGDDCTKDHKHRRGQPNQRDDRSQVCG